MLIQRYLQHRKIPRLMHDAAIAIVQFRLQTGTHTFLTDWLRYDIDHRAQPADADVHLDD